MKNMEGSHGRVDAKFAGVKRKAVTKELWNKKKQVTMSPLIENGFGNLPVPGSFMKLHEVLQIYKYAENVLECVPPGKKNNVFYVIDDSINALKRERNEPTKYQDNCGEWKNNGFSRSFFIQKTDGGNMCLKERDNLFYKDSHVKGGSLLAPLNPQPDPNTLIKVYRRLFVSKRNGYKRRITSLSGNGKRSIALIEYSDTSIGVSFDSVHGAGKNIVDNEEESTSSAVNENHLQRTSERDVCDAEKHYSSSIAVKSKHGLETKKKVVDGAGKSTNIAVKSKHGLGTKKKVVHNVVKRPKGRPPLNRAHNVVKRPRGRPRIHKRLPSMSKMPRSRPPPHPHRVRLDDSKTNLHTVSSIHTKSKRYRSPSSRERRANGMPAFDIDAHEDDEWDAHEDDEWDAHEDDEWVPRRCRKIPRKTTLTTTGMQKSTALSNEDFLMSSLIEENPSVQEVIHRKSKPPCVILYSDKQFSDMKRNLECESVLGVDCTYKSGDCYITMTVYQNSRALHKDTNEPLLFLGPVYLHWDKEFLTYVSFFSHIMDKLEGVEPNIEVKLGSDIEAPLFKALKFSFPTSPHILDCHHLKKTVNRKLLAIVSGKVKLCSVIFDQIFGEEGIINSPCLAAFENGVSDLAYYFDEFPHLKSYFGGLQSFLYPYVCEPLQRGISQRLWVNGNDKVLKNQLHTVLKDKHNELSEIVKEICTITNMQMLELKDI